MWLPALFLAVGANYLIDAWTGADKWNHTANWMIPLVWYVILKELFG